MTPRQSVPRHAAGVRRYQEIHTRLQSMLDELWRAPAKERGEHPNIPQDAGVYLFADKGRPLYVGQTRNLRQRLALHTRPSSSQESASFAFNIAKREAARQGRSFKGTRKAIAKAPAFGFLRAKATVAKMDVRFMTEADACLRTVFEVYATLVLGTEEFNTFETH